VPFLPSPYPHSFLFPSNQAAIILTLGTRTRNRGGVTPIESLKNQGHGTISSPGRIRVLAGAIAFLALVSCAWSQTNSAPLAPGSIHGVVQDREGTVCEGAHIALAQSGSSASPTRTAISDSEGRYVFGDVPAGPFQLTFSADGFASQTVSGVLGSGQSYEAQPVVLLITNASSEVQVTASRADVEIEQVREEEQQRVLGAIPNFYVTYVHDAPPLTSKQKFSISWKSSIDPVSFLTVGAAAGIEQATNSYSAWGQGSEGYAKRYAAGYADDFIGTMLGGAILPSLLKQDPRYFYKGTGTVRARILYAIANAVICKSDSGRWQPNYSSIGASFASAGISNLYYPAANRNGMTLTFENFFIDKATGAAENIFQEFVVRKLTPKIPNYNSSKP
jgi:hypothetical protein